MHRAESIIEKTERVKHELLWENNGHPDRPEGGRFFLRAWSDLVPQYRESLCDWGIGDGKVAQQFKDRGLRVTGIDIVRGCAKHFDGHVLHGPIWEPPLVPGQLFQYGYCANVLEYVPNEMIIPTLQVMKKHTVDVLWFAISSESHPTHRTVKPAHWWASAFALAFPRFYFVKEETQYIVQAYSELVK